MRPVPDSLKLWFTIHFVVDLVFGLPLLLFPILLLQIFELPVTNLLFVRLTGAALIGIGTVSLLAKHETKETYKQLLNLKILWSSAALVAIILSLLEQQNFALWFTLFVFLIFHVVWWYWSVKIRSLIKQQ